MSALRITGGVLRGRKVPLPGHDLRPTSQKARQAYFNIVAGRVVDASFLDLFAGSGIFALEAVSRGASNALAVDQSGGAMNTLRALAREWKLPLETMTADVLAALKTLGARGPFDLIYADPPYQYPRYVELLRAMDRLALAPQAVVALEHPRHVRPNEGSTLSQLIFRKTAHYGNVSISLFDRSE
jgi:16S rRNA (guanine966-N2)-methyltransferase